MPHASASGSECVPSDAAAAALAPSASWLSADSCPSMGRGTRSCCLRLGRGRPASNRAGHRLRSRALRGAIRHRPKLPLRRKRESRAIRELCRPLGQPDGAGRRNSAEVQGENPALRSAVDLRQARPRNLPPSSNRLRPVHGHVRKRPGFSLRDRPRLRQPVQYPSLCRALPGDRGTSRTEPELLRGLSERPLTARFGSLGADALCAGPRRRGHPASARCVSRAGGKMSAGHPTRYRPPR